MKDDGFSKWFQKESLGQKELSTQILDLPERSLLTR
jgi:hypothetical protein